MGARVHTSSAGCGPCLFPGGSWPGHHRGGGWRQPSGGCSCVDVSVLRTAGKPVGLTGQPSRLVAAAPALSVVQAVPQPSSPFPRPPGAQLRPQSFARSRQAGPRLGQSLLMLSLELRQAFTLLSACHLSASSHLLWGSRLCGDWPLSAWESGGPKGTAAPSPTHSFL